MKSSASPACKPAPARDGDFSRVSRRAAPVTCAQQPVDWRAVAGTRTCSTEISVILRRVATHARSAPRQASWSLDRLRRRHAHDHTDPSPRELGLGRLCRRSMRSSLRKSNRMSSGRSAVVVLPITCRSVAPTLPRKTTLANCGYFCKWDMRSPRGGWGSPRRRGEEYLTV